MTTDQILAEAQKLLDEATALDIDRRTSPTLKAHEKAVLLRQAAQCREDANKLIVSTFR